MIIINLRSHLEVNINFLIFELIIYKKRMNFSLNYALTSERICRVRG